MKRRDFIKYGAGGLAALAIGCKKDSSPPPPQSSNPVTPQPTPPPAALELSLTFTDAIKHMVTDNAINAATCYFWVFKASTPFQSFAPDSPGPLIFATEGQTINLTLTNALGQPHRFAVPAAGIVSPTLAPGAANIPFSFTAPKAGTYLYYDDLNAPVNRVMGLHGALLVMPLDPLPGHRFTPYSNPTPTVQQLFDDLGTAPWWPGLAWEQGDPGTDTPIFRQNVWIMHQASPNLFAQVGSLPAGQLFDPAAFVDAFLNSPFDPDPNNNFKPQYFTINGQSGHFSHNNPYITPFNRVGEPTLVRALNAGLMTVSNHIHANHVYLTALNNVVQANTIWFDTFTQKPLDTYDWLLPFMRQPDVPNVGGVGRGGSGDAAVTSVPNPAIPGSVAHPVWPPNEELNAFIPTPVVPRPGQTILSGVPTFTAQDQFGNQIDLAVQLSPMCYPMHDHSEPTQTAQGGNYLCGTVSGILFTGDRNDPTGVVTFPNPPQIHGPGPQGVFPPTVEFNAFSGMGM